MLKRCMPVLVTAKLCSSPMAAVVRSYAGTAPPPESSLQMPEIEPTKEGSYVANIFKTMEDILSGLLALRGSII